ncbi:hypothetical protein ZWY2020_049166 [Hordeum vulgare]|nr:hypothetical protein ZWY2020_049166 [Hordeum vulgare]
MDCMQLEMENTMLEAMDAPLAFENGGCSPKRQGDEPAVLDSPKMLPCLLPCIVSPATGTVNFWMEAITQRVGEIQIGSGQEHAAVLFAVVPPSVLPSQLPLPRHSSA